MLNRAEEALPCLTTAERLSPGWHLMWGVKLWQCEAYRALGRWAEANAAVDESISLLPTNPAAHVAKAHISMQLGQGGEARSHVDTARRLGYDLAMAERRWRRVLPNSPTLEADIATIRALYAAAEECR